MNVDFAFDGRGFLLPHSYTLVCFSAPTLFPRFRRRVNWCGSFRVVETNGLAESYTLVGTRKPVCHVVNKKSCFFLWRNWPSFSTVAVEKWLQKRLETNSCDSIISVEQVSKECVVFGISQS